MISGNMIFVVTKGRVSYGPVDYSSGDDRCHAIQFCCLRKTFETGETVGRDDLTNHSVSLLFQDPFGGVAILRNCADMLERSIARGFDEAHLKIKAFTSICGFEVFEINGIEAEQEDFVDKRDRSPETAVDRACGNMQAEILPVNQHVLDRYEITEEDYFLIAGKVSKLLSFGACDRCV